MKHPLSRRTVLRGLGVSLGLPWLEAMASTAAPKPPVRMAMLYMPNGVNTSMWTPAGAGRALELSPTLEPLAAVKDRTVVLSNLWNANSIGGDGHYVKEAAILTCATIRKTPGADLANGTSVDQVAAQAARGRTPLASIELGVTPVAIGVDAVVGYTRVYGSHIAWSSPTTPLAREIDPRAVYQRLYRAATEPAEDVAKMDALLLDRVLSDARRLRGEVGAADRLRLDEYLAAMRSLEERVERARAPAQRTWRPRAVLDPAAAPAERPAGHAEHVRLMLDMIAAAFQSDTTRVATFMFGNAVSNVNFRFLEGVTAGHHDTSHHENKPDKLREYQIINRWHVEQYAYLLGKLAAMPEGESNVLDNSMVLFASALSDGQKHDMHKLPVVLAGGAGGRIEGGRHLVYAEDSPLANLYVAMLDAFGTPVPRFADSTGPLAGLLRESGLMPALLLAAAALSGIWTGQLPGRNGVPQDVAFRFEEAGGALTGKLYGDYRSTPVVDGKMTGGEFSFTVVAQEQAGNQINETTYRYTGRLVDGEIELTRRRERSANAGNAGSAELRESPPVTFRLKRLLPAGVTVPETAAAARSPK